MSNVQVDALTLCESKRDATDCKRVAQFRYFPETRDMPPLDLCDEHTYSLMQAGTDRTRFVTIAVRRRTYRCRSCVATFKLEVVGLDVAGIRFRFCPNCAKESITVVNDIGVDYWALLAESVGLPVSIVKAAHSMWDSSSGQNFTDFITEMRNEVRASNNAST